MVDYNLDAMLHLLTLVEEVMPSSHLSSNHLPLRPLCGYSRPTCSHLEAHRWLVILIFVLLIAKAILLILIISS